MKGLFNLNKGGLLVAQVVTTMLNYGLWLAILKPLGASHSVAIFNSELYGGAKLAAHAASYGKMYLIAKVMVYLLTTGLFILLLTKDKAYKKLSMGTAVLGCSVVALIVDFLNMTLLPSFIFYTLTTVLILSSKDFSAEEQVQKLQKIA